VEGLGNEVPVRVSMESVIICVSNTGCMDIGRSRLFHLGINKSLKDFWELRIACRIHEIFGPFVVHES
jgi:hypothetical protein